MGDHSTVVDEESREERAIELPSGHEVGTAVDGLRVVQEVDADLEHPDACGNLGIL